MRLVIHIITLGSLLLLPHISLARPEGVVISAVGDIMLAGSARPTLERHGYDYPFAATRDILKKSDIAIGNLEAPIADRGSEFRDKKYRFKCAPDSARALRDAGFSLLTLANNHILDFGATGLQSTVRYLDGYGIRHCGAGSTLNAARTPVIITVNGKRVAFLAYSLTQPVEFFATNRQGGTAPGYASFVTTDVRSARKSADYVIVSFHWGRELSQAPSPAQVRLAHLAIDAGADVILGHHPHVLQGIERYHQGIIFYSLGNFAFGSLSRSADKSIIARITLNGGINEVEIVPINVLNRQVHFQPTPLAGREGDRVVEQLNRLSEGMGTVVAMSGERFLVSGFQRLARH